MLALELLCRIKPYKGGDFGLWEIRKADNIDKHNLIIPSVVVTELTGFKAIDEVNETTFNPPMVTVGAGGCVGMVRYVNGGAVLKIKDKGNASATITFSDAMEVFSGKPVFPTLRESIHLVSQAVDRIELVASSYL